MKKAPPLLYAASEHSADLLYFGGFSAPDPFAALEAGGRKLALFNALEFGRAKKESSFDEVLSLEEYQEKARKRWKTAAPSVAQVIATLAFERGQKLFTIADDFPAALASKLNALGVKTRFADGALFPERELKTAFEILALKEGNRCAARGIDAGARLLRAAKVRGGKLFYKGEVLTSERLKFAIEVACLEAGSLSLNTIAAGGDQACDPHCTGQGPIRANELVIFDVFPRVQKTGYFGDMTRTFLKGRASDAQRSLVAAVAAAQKGALKAITAGVNGRAVHRGVIAEFEKRGYKTTRTEKGARGFFHGTGHGVGLEIHEMPRLSGAVDCTLAAGAVVTVEPGLYYPGLGACRIEDVVQVTDGKPRMLSSYPYEWELR